MLRPWLRDAVLVAAAKTATSLGVLFTGFRAISDDDFARIVIAERFAGSPSFDPSGTSWLPFPFWIQGSVMAVAGRSITTARTTAFILGVLAALLVWAGARTLGIPRRAAIAGAIVGSAFPYAAWLGVATVPEALTGALVVFGVATLSVTGRARSVGALALALACLSRYEPWPVAAVFALFCAIDAARQKKLSPLLPGGLAISGAVGWLVHGVLHHHDAWFFVTRVTAYKRAIGGGGQSALEAAFAFPSMLVRSEPEVVALALVATGFLLVKDNPKAFPRYRRAIVALGALLVFLVVGELRDGAPTHHPERALLAIWIFVAIFATDGLFEVLGERKLRAASIGAVLVSLGVAAVIVRPWYARRDSFIDRTSEIAIGQAARSQDPNGTLVVEHPDFGFYAVIAGFGAPERASPIDDHDPRKSHGENVFASPDTLRALIEERKATLVVLSKEHWSSMESSPIAERGGLRLFESR